MPAASIRALLITTSKRLVGAPQVAATLAAAMVGYDTFNAAGERLLAEKIFNANLVLLVVTSLLGPVLTELFTPGMITEEARTKKATA